MPSDTLVIEEAGSPKPPATPPTEQNRVAIEDTPAGPSPEEAIETARKNAEEAGRRADTEAAARRAAESRAQEAERRAQEYHRERQGDRVTVLSAAVEAANAELEAAERDLAAAIEAGDPMAQAKANRRMATAGARYDRTKAEFDTAKSGQPDPSDRQGEPQRHQQQGAASEATQRWIEAHPAFNSDAACRNAMFDAHRRAVADGIQVETPAYFRALDQAYEAHMQQGRQPPAGQQPTRFDGAPPSRGDGGGSSTVQVDLGDGRTAAIGVHRSGGRVTFQIPRADRADLEEGARIANMSLPEYVQDLVNIHSERRSHGTPGSSDGTQVWR